jgi:transposase
MAGRFAGWSDLEWRLFEDLFPPAPPQRGRGMPRPPCRQGLHTWLYSLMTGGRWCDVPRGPQWASQRAPHRWVPRWQADGTLAAMHARSLGLAEERGLIRWEYGAVDGAFSPWPGGRRGRRLRGQGHRGPDPQPHRGARAAGGALHHASQGGCAGPRGAPAGCPQEPHRPPGAPAQTSQSPGARARRCCASPAAAPAPAWEPGADPPTGLAAQAKPGQTEQTRGVPGPGRADLCRVPADVSPLGGPLGAPCGLL